MAACLDQVERTNPRINAIVTLVPEWAMRDARAADGRLAEALARGEEVGPLHGLPVAHKDLAPTRGIRTTFGSLIYEDFVPEEDALIVERLRRAGAITVGLSTRRGKPATPRARATRISSVRGPETRQYRWCTAD